MRRSRTTHRGRFAAVFAVAAACAAGAPWVAAQDGDESLPPIEPGDAASKPADPKSVGEQVIEEAIASARAEKQRIEDSYREQAIALDERIAGIQSEIVDARGEERELLEEFETLQADLQKLDEELFEVEATSQRAVDNVAAVDREIVSQAVDFRDRFRGGLLGAQYPELLEEADAIQKDKSQDADARLDRLIDLYAEARLHAGATDVFEMPIRLAGDAGVVDTVKVLRIGLLSGYYFHEPTGQAGFVLADAEDQSSPASFEGESSGLTSAQQAAIVRVIEDPAAGGLLAADPTGGAGIATLRGAVSFAEWFERGGVFMWVLATIAIIVIVLVIERAIRLQLMSFGMQRRIDRVLGLIEDGDVESAEALCERGGTATEEVLHAALVHRDQGRSVMEDAAQEALLNNAPKFSSRLSFIALCAAISPLVGLLGTVTGMITTFKMITLFGTSDPRFMAGGISEALITTQGGLCVAIPALVCRALLGAQAESGVAKLEAGAMSVILALLKREELALDEATASSEEARSRS